MKEISTEKSEDGMYDCFYIEGLKCNQKPRCDKGEFEAHCVMNGFKMALQKIHAQHDLIKKDGMLEAILWLFGHNYIRRRYYHLSASKIVERILEDEERDKIE